jgi:enoyl-CoA hydratase
MTSIQPQPQTQTIANSIVSYQLNNSIATISMDDGKVNVMSLRMLAELNKALDRAIADKAAAIVLTGRPGVFSSGFDLKVLTAGGTDAFDMLKNGFELAERLFSLSMPVVIACTGHAIAMGVFLVLSVDYRVCADGPYKIGANEVAIGLTMPHFAIEICRQRLAPAYFSRAVNNAETFAPDQAVIAGFLDQVVPGADLQNVAQNKAIQLTKLNLASHAATKLRVREQTLKAIRRAIESDIASFRARQ